MAVHPAPPFGDGGLFDPSTQQLLEGFGCSPGVQSKYHQAVHSALVVAAEERGAPRHDPTEGLLILAADERPGSCFGGGGEGEEEAEEAEEDEEAHFMMIFL